VANSKVLALLVFALALCTSAVHADHYFYSVACNELTGDNDRFWDALAPFPLYDSSRSILRDDWYGYDTDRNDGRDTIYDDLLWYGDNLGDGDVLVFSYWGHGGWYGLGDSSNDEGSDWPYEGDPLERDHNNYTTDPPFITLTPPYEDDEFFGYSFTGSTSDDVMTDDRLADCLDRFDAGVEVVVVSAACHSGGWVGGTDDMDYSEAADNYGLYAMLGAPEHSYGIMLNGGDYRSILNEALCETLEDFYAPAPSITFPEWYAAALTWGQNEEAYIKRDWWPTPGYVDYWPAAGWTPSSDERTRWTDGTYLWWGWEDNYLQLRPTEFNSLDAEHDRLATPEPTSTSLVVLGLLGLAARRRLKQS